MNVKNVFRPLVGFIGAVLIALVATFTIFSAQAQQLAPVLRISTENAPNHVQTRVVQLFVERLQKRVGDKLTVEFYPGAKLYRDRNVIKAIADGKVEMAVPGTWQLDRFQPNVGIFLLPMFYGRDAEVNYKLRDGSIGRTINGQIGDTLGVQVIGRWIDLGHAHLYSVDKPIRTHDDLDGMAIRIAGGEANAARIQALGATPTIIPWPDLPQALQNGTIAGVLTTHATVVSAKLWEKGIRNAFEDKQYFPQYVPMISTRFWKRLPEDVRRAIQDTWESVVEEGRAMARVAQKEAYDILTANGVSIITPSHEALAKWRETMLADQPELVRKMGINPLLVEEVRTALGN